MIQINKLSAGCVCTFGRFKKPGKVLIEVAFSFPCGFFFSVMLPLNFIHLNNPSSSTSFLVIQNSERMFNIGKVRFHKDVLLFNYLIRNSNTLLELRYMKYIMDCGKLQRKSQSISHWSTFCDDLVRSDVSRS